MYGTHLDECKIEATAVVAADVCVGVMTKIWNGDCSTRVWMEAVAATVAEWQAEVKDWETTQDKMVT